MVYPIWPNLYSIETQDSDGFFISKQAACKSIVHIYRPLKNTVLSKHLSIQKADASVGFILHHSKLKCG